jgi:omega-amidase
MAEELRFTLVQSPLYWEQKEPNREHFSALLDSAADSADVIVLPEMFSTGFSMNTAVAETMEGETMAWMKHEAATRNAVICGSLMMNDAGTLYNRFVWMPPDGKYLQYDKRHLFRMGNEHRHYQPGTSSIIIEHKGWKILPLVCYDLRFPVWSRRTPALDYDAIVIVANWPERRSMHWRTLLQARAIENQSYVVAVNRTGDDGNGVYHSGNSGLVSPKGEWLAEAEHKTTLLNVILRKQEVSEWRNVFPAADDADRFSIEAY